jgi:hypothetical protein
MTRTIDFDNQFDALKVATINDPDYGDFSVHLMIFDGFGGSTAVSLNKQAALQLAERLESAAERIGKGAEKASTDF